MGVYASEGTVKKPSDPTVLIVAAEEGLRNDLAGLMGDHAVLATAAQGSAVLEILESSQSLRLMIVVEHEADGAALDLLQAAKERHDGLAVLVLSPHPTIAHATEAIRRGAEDFISVPFSPELLRKEVDRIMEAAELRDGIVQLRSFVSAAYGFDHIVSNSPRMRPVFERALAASRSDTPVLITGETGTGKELLARAIHANGRRRNRAFVPVNCAALPRDLVESELFGHRRGAFSGAHADHPGLFAAAHRGTLLLDEIGELPVETQAKLLRALQNGEIRSVGGLESRSVDVRVIAATNRSIQELRAGALRQDLFFRLSVLVIEVPPLRARPDDLPRLIDHFLARYRCCGAARLCRIEADALDLLVRYPFPGNVRELENLVQSLCATLPPDRPAIRAEDVRAWLRRQGVEATASSEADGGPLNLEELQRSAIRSAIDRAGGNKSRAAQLLGISRDTLYRKLLESEPVKGEVVRLSDRRRI